MVTASEFRAGNLVYLTKDNFATKKRYELDAFDIYKLSESDCVDIAPIPICEKILLDFGFSKSYAAFSRYYAHSKLAVRLYDGGMIKIFFEDKLILGEDIGENISLYADKYYAHKLQNLYFAIFQEELIYKPIKKQL